MSQTADGKEIERDNQEHISTKTLCTRKKENVDPPPSPSATKLYILQDGNNGYVFLNFYMGFTNLIKNFSRFI